VARSTGISQRDLLGAIDAASEKGSGADAVTNLDRIATQATAMGTDATTIAKMRSQMKVSSKVTGREMNDDEIDAFMAKMHFIGKTGVFRAEDVAAAVRIAHVAVGEERRRLQRRRRSTSVHQRGAQVDG
jgi:hypothetical protein